MLSASWLVRSPWHRHLLIFFGWVTLAVPLANAQIDFSSLDALVESELRREDCPGASIAIVMGEEVVYAKGYGVASVETNAPVTSDMLFRIGSTTKMMTATALLMLAEEERLSLHSPLGDWIEGLDPTVARLTPHQLLTHTSGLADPNAMNGPHDEDALEMRVRALSSEDFFDGPDTIYSYANPGYWISGLAVEKASDMRFADFLDSRIFKPLSMRRSTFRPTMAMTWPLAIGHSSQGKKRPAVIRPLADNAAVWPAGQLFSTAPEFARFLIAFMNGGRVEGRQVLSPFVIEQLSTPHVSIPNSDSSYGYGLNVRDVHRQRWLSHSGSRTGYGSHVRMCPEQKFGVVILCNKTGISLIRVAEQAARLAIGAEPAPPPERSEQTMDDEEIERYVGRYVNGRNTLTISLNDRRLVLTGNRPITKVGSCQFVAREVANAARLEFSLVFDEQGHPTHLLARGRAFKKQPIANPTLPSRSD